MKSRIGGLVLVLGILMSQVKVGLDDHDKPRKFVPNNKPIKKVIPKGCKEYSFTYDNGEKFTCVASKDANAKKKFKKFLEQLKL